MRKLAAAIVIIVALLCSTACAELAVHYLDVGHGDCAIITCDGHSMIIDGGKAGCSDLVYTYINKIGITEIDYAIASHPDADHIGGLPAAFHAATVKSLYTPVLEHDTERFATLMQTARDKGVEIIVPKAGDVLPLGGGTVTILAPQELSSDSNDNSIVILLEYGSTRFLFCADAGEKTESRLQEQYPDLHADVVKVAHHGSGTASRMRFVLAVSPRYAVISGNGHYDNPDAETVTKWLVGQSTVLHTMDNGTIVIHSDGEALTLDNEPMYVGNRNSGVFHRYYCASVAIMKNKHKALMFTRAEAIFRGFRPCQNCAP